MKCENCGKNEVTFYFKSNVNGKITEKHLCSECAEKLGYTQSIAAHSQQMVNSLFGGDFLKDFFTPMPGLLGHMDQLFGEDLLDDFFSELPALGAAPEEAAPAESGQKAEKKQELVSGEEQSRFARMRELNALRLELKKAIRQENFEHAAELRDKIHGMEKTGK